MKPNQIKIKNINTKKEITVTIKDEYVYTFGKKHLYCGCTGKTEKTATPMQYNKTEGVYCPNCHEKKVEIIQTYDEWKKIEDEKQARINKEKLETLHLVEAGSDWECGFKYYTLSANIDYDDWLKVKEHFRYYHKGWSRGQELEWEYGEPTGWLTMKPDEVEKILLKEGLIKPENTMKAIAERNEQAKIKRENERKQKRNKINSIKKEMNTIEKDICELFNDAENLTDADARFNFIHSNFGKGTVVTYTIKNDEIIKCRHMGDFIHSIKVSYSKKLHNLIKDYYKLNDVLLNL